VTPYLAAVILLTSLVGYLGGFIVIDVSHRRRMSAVSAAYHLDAVSKGIEESGGNTHNAVQQTSSPNGGNNVSPPDVTPAKPEPGARPANVEQSLDAPSDIGKCEGPCKRRSDGRASSYGQWFNWSWSAFLLYAYTAVFDDRPTLELDKSLSAGYVRLIVVSSKLSEKSGEGGK
jgi:hypothetical protein